MYDFFTYLQEPQLDLLCCKQVIHSHRKPSFVTKSNSIWLGVLFKARMQTYKFHPRFDTFVFYPFLDDYIFSLLSACLFHALTLLCYAPPTLEKIVIFLLHKVLLFVFSSQEFQENFSSEHLPKHPYSARWQYLTVLPSVSSSALTKGITHTPTGCSQPLQQFTTAGLS